MIKSHRPEIAAPRLAPAPFNVPIDTAPATIAAMARTNADTSDAVTSIHLPTWVRLVAAWEPWVRAATDSDDSVRLRTYHVLRLGREIDTSPLDVTPQQLLEWITSNTWKPNTRRSYRSSLRSFFGWLRDTGQRPDNPAGLIPKPPATPAVPKPAPTPVIQHAMDDAGDRDREHVVLAIRLGAECALRRAEIAAVHSRDVQQYEGEWWLRVTGKGSKQRNVPLNEDLALAIRERSGWLWPNHLHPERHVSPKWVGTSIARYLNRSTDLGHYTAHTLRHRAATVAYNGSKDLLSVQRFLGHAKSETTEGYTLVAPEAIRAAAGHAVLAVAPDPR